VRKVYPSVVQTKVGGLKGLVIENERIRLVLTPEFGSRIVSMIYKPSETEFVWHNPRVPIMKPTYQPEFEDMSGLFDCVPTCENCDFKGRKLPMYGEVASEPWRVITVEKGKRSASVKVQRKCEIYPLSVRKKITLTKNEAKVKLDYQLANLSDEELEYHYSGHNTLQINPNYRIILPREVKRFKRGMAITDRLGKLGDEVAWPLATDVEGKTVDLSKVGGPCDGTGENLYTPKLSDSWCAAFNETRNEAIGFQFQANVLPYILVWINWGGYLGYYHMALEPSSGRPDNLKTAVNEWKNYSSLRPRSTVSWTTRIFMGHDVKHVEKVTEQGIVQ
jgi:galactose mutarotase-like enzyme